MVGERKRRAVKSQFTAPPPLSFLPPSIMQHHSLRHLSSLYATQPKEEKFTKVEAQIIMYCTDTTSIYYVTILTQVQDQLKSFGDTRTKTKRVK